MDILLKIEPREIFTQVVEDILNNLFVNHTPTYDNISIDAASITEAKAEIKKIILDTNLNTASVTALLAAKHYENVENVRVFISLLEKRKKELLNSTLVHYNCSFGETLNTFDWKLKMICGTSELKTFSNPLLQLALYTVTVHHKPAEKLYELDKDMLSRLITTLEEVV